MPIDHHAILVRAQAYVDRKYVQQADARQKRMGLAYVTAERTDLAKEIARFTIAEIERLHQPVGKKEPSDSSGYPPGLDPLDLHG